MPAFLLLGVIWAAVLLPPWLQSRREARPTASMVTFRRQLWSLARTSPGYSPVYTDAFGAYEDDHSGDPADGPIDDGDGVGDDSEGDELARRRSAVAPASSQGPAPRRTRRVAGSYRRRRHILAVLAVLAAASVAPAVLLAGAWWIAPAVVGGLLLTYLTLLVRRQRRITEQLRKVRYLAPIRAPRPAVVVLGTGTAR
ncbi:MAG TPA: hypothetical protein VKD21_08940 [Acidimicrobiales bacterium]|nr:hypothetical protein [Acidimicrobiales bacterium]